MFSVSPGVVAAGLTIAAMGASLAGKGQLATFLGSPEAAQALTVLIGSAGTLIAGILQGVQKKETVVVAAQAPAPTPAAAASKLRAGKA